MSSSPRGGQRTHHDATGGGMSDAMSSHPFLIDTNREQQRVTITYDAEKTTPAQLLKSFTRFGYKATEVNDSLQQKPARQ